MTNHPQQSGDEPSLGGQPQQNDVRLGGESALLHLIESLNHSDPRVRKRAAFMLAGRGHTSAYETLIELLDQDDSRLRVSAMRALGRLRDHRATELLVTLLRDQSERRQIRIAAARALGDLGNTEAVELLLEELMHYNKVLTVPVVNALGKLGDARAIPRLQEIFINRSPYPFSDPEITSAALEALVALQGDQLLSNLLAHPVFGSLNVIRAVATLADPRSIPELINIVNERISDRRMLQLTKHSSNYLEIVVEALGNFGGSSAVEPLMELTKYLPLTETTVINKTLTALGKLGDKRALPRLVSKLNSESGSYAAQALGELGDYRAVEPLITSLAKFQQANRRVRANMLGNAHAYLRALRKLADPRSVKAIASCLEEREQGLRLLALEALSSIGTQEVVEPILNALMLDDPYVRGQALLALGTVYDLDSRIPSAVINALEDEASFVRINAAQILGEHRERTAVFALIGRLANEGVQRAVRTALRRIGTPEALAAIRDARS